MIESCQAIENRRFNPFLLDISEALDILRLHSKEWTELNDHLLDMKALASLAKVVGLQSANLRFQSSTLYVDPSMLREKLRTVTRDQLAEILLLSWHPIVELEQLTVSATKEALEYWSEVVPFSERWKRFHPGPVSLPATAAPDELHHLGFLADKAFGRRLDEFWKELKNVTGPRDRIDYWTFVRGRSRSETVSRAQLASFLVTYGYAILDVEDDEHLVLIPKDEPSIRKESTPVSFPITIPHEVR
ncbi:MAG TPA: hypothetical protein VE177_06725 [Candidatus Binatus sp.]|nr:hypothetical protein [Candidatus Binatus sp.]